ncbi:MAG: hypothetical protein CVV39_08385 [Planctomycetes bacterium HGW-Planctomycetes-1]|nr:MAG: hypothetical protein CVV39_08385 [Planctomycetes bacterium HGW-Planctomycetes-1]
MKKTKQFERGSALIMTIVLTVLLAIVAVMFLTVARMDRASTSNIADNKTLDSAAKSIVEIINKQLINDIPGAAGQEYYDYPDSENPWLASIEPYFYSDNGTPADINDDIYRWRQISDITGHIQSSSVTPLKRPFATKFVKVKPSGSTVIEDYPEIKLNADNELKEGNKDDGEFNNEYRGQPADADGDGILDSKWFELEDLRSSKGQRIYAAVRVIDNDGMVNVNTAHSFNANTADGTSQMQVNLKGLLKGTTAQINTQMTDFNEARCGGGSGYWPNYERNVVWDYNTVPDGNYLPFDISDELELRYRYCIDSKFVARIEANTPALRVIPETTDAYGDPGGLYDTRTGWGLGRWQQRITNPDYSDKADRRHMLTTVNYDRIITPAGGKMTNINTADADSLYTAVRRGLIDADSNFTDVNEISAQIAVNIKDYHDSDSNVAVIRVDDVNYYGFERPCVYISELAYRGEGAADGNNSYAVELYKPDAADDAPNGWKLLIDSNTYDVNWSGGKQFYVIAWQDSNCPLTIDYTNASVYTIDNNISPKVIFNTETAATDSMISLIREVNDVNVVVDSYIIPRTQFIEDRGSYSIERDINPNKCIMRLWNSTVSGSPTLGVNNGYDSTDANMLQAHPKNIDFTNIGEIGMVFRKPAYYKLVGDSNTGKIGYSATNKTETAVRLNLADQNYQHIFKYLTVMDPRNIRPTDPNYINETRIKGRININTAPAYVIAQLPWVAKRQVPYNEPNLAQAIVAYRDRTWVKVNDANYPNYTGRSGPAGFKTIGQLCNVTKDAALRNDPNYRIDYYKRVAGNYIGYPDLTNDTVADDFEERDLIFARISDLVTVRSDVFTAYILVRVGVDGPQKRYMVILDRTGVNSSADRVRIIAFQSVPEAR